MSVSVFCGNPMAFQNYIVCILILLSRKKKLHLNRLQWKWKWFERIFQANATRFCEEISFALQRNSFDFTSPQIRRSLGGIIHMCRLKLSAMKNARNSLISDKGDNCDATFLWHVQLRSFSLQLFPSLHSFKFHLRTFPLSINQNKNQKSAIEKALEMTLRKVTAKFNSTYCSSLTLMSYARHLIDELKTWKAWMFNLFDPELTTNEAKPHKIKEEKLLWGKRRKNTDAMKVAMKSK